MESLDLSDVRVVITPHDLQLLESSLGMN